MKNLIFKTLFLIIFISCSKDETVEDPLAKLPPITQTGANTFACVVHNQVFLPRNGQGTLGGISGAKGVIIWGFSGSPNFGNANEFDVGNYRDGKPINNMIIHLQEIKIRGAGEYIWQTTNFQKGIDGPLHDYVYCKVYDSSIDAWKYYGSFENSGKVTISRYDFDNRIISGTFSGKLREQNGTREIEITHGRFDIDKATIGNVYFP